jgi:hypothetical protein
MKKKNFNVLFVIEYIFALANLKILLFIMVARLLYGFKSYAHAFLFTLYTYQ